jgi:hypothetical protein
MCWNLRRAMPGAPSTDGNLKIQFDYFIAFDLAGISFEDPNDDPIGLLQ